MSLRPDIQSLAASLVNLAKKAVDEQEQTLAVELLRFASWLDGWLEGERERPLTGRHQSGNVDDMVTAERVRHSKGSLSGDPLKMAANTAGFTIRSLAEKINVSHALLSKARKGERSIEKALATEIQRLTGFPATKKNWPLLKE